ncbi:factor of DNA methylation 5-like [Gastrolobium bilobum]|uniref:factor of DNA methylation 5-like n=1 Tax=Gastrolobium bilobum TaxID=150636 RepID=UPI002AAFA7FA|nr:factor of DNA methylation 5-like [Gastrolobium bilobum]
MGSSSEESDISECEMDDFIEKSYNQLKAGKYKKIKNPNSTFRCPFCEGKKKRSFQFGELLLHASGIGIGSSKRSIQIKAKHLALAKYLKEDISNEFDDSLSKPVLEIANEQPKQDQMFVWPWKGIVANILGKSNHESENNDSELWLKRFEQYKPKEAHVLHCADDPRGYVILDFGTEWIGFRQVMKLDTDFLTANHGKKDWDSREESHGSDFYAWCARAEDYNSEGLVGTYLREKTELKTTSKVTQDSWKERSQTVAHLVEEIDFSNKIIGEVEKKYTETSISLNRIMEERDLLNKARVQEMARMQQHAREHVLRVIEETEKLKCEIHTKNVELDRWCQQLSEQETSTVHERRKFEEEKKRKMESIILASEEQVKANHDFFGLLEKHQIEKKAQMNKLLKLEKELDDEHKLKLEIAELEGQLKVLRCMNVMGADPEKDRKKQIEKMEKKLEEMIEDMSEKEYLSQVLMLKEQPVKRELEDARQELIAVIFYFLDILAELPKLLKGSTVIGVKKLGEINAKPFQKVCKYRYKDCHTALSESAKLHSKWQSEILDSTWHPFRIIDVEGEGKQEVIDEDDQKLSTLKEDLGEEAYMAVLTALKELNEYNSSSCAKTTPNQSGRSVIPELWNFRSGRKATLDEVIAYIKGRINKIG